MAIFTVTEQSATGAGSLASAVAAAAANTGPDTIVFAADVTRIVTSGTLAIDSNVTIDGDRNNDGVADVTISSDIDTNGIGNHTLFILGTGANVTFDGLVFTEGFDAGTSAADIAVGAILNNGTATIRNSQFTDNQAVGWVGQNGSGGTPANLTGGNGTDGGAAVGAILNRGVMSIQNTLFSGNSGIGGNGGAGGNGAYIPGAPPFGIDVGGSGGDGANGGFGAGAIVNFTGGALTLSGVELDDNTGVAGNGGNGGNGYRVGISVNAMGGTGGAAGHGSATILDFGTMSGTVSTSGGAFSGGIGGERGTPLPIILEDTPYVRPDGVGGLQPTRIGTAGNDTRTGLAMSEVFGGLAGDDSFVASAGNDVFNGGDGSDTIVLSTVTAGVTFNLASAAAQFIRIGNLTVAGVENATGGAGNDTLTGNGGANTLRGMGGNDIVNSAGGGDTMIGGAGNDFYHVTTNDVIVEVVGEGVDTVNAYRNFVLTAGAQVERLQVNDPAAALACDLTGNDFSQTLVGGAGANRLDGMGGSDTIQGGAGADTIYGGSGNDTIDGGPGGVDTMFGGLGDDIFYVDLNSDRVRENIGEGYDTVYASADFTLFGTAEIEVLSVRDPNALTAITLTGNSFSQRISGGAGANILNGGGGNDTLIGFGGADTMRGGAGNDVYGVAEAGDIVDETAAGSDGVDRVTGSISINLSDIVHFKGAVEHATLIGSANLNLTGNALANVLTGNAGVNTLIGLGGNDVMRGLGGNDLYGVAEAGDVVDESVAGSGGVDRVNASVSVNLSDTVHFKGAIEHATLIGSANLYVYGNALNNVLTGNTGANTLIGYAGADTMRGMAGNDFYGVDNVGDIVDESIAGSGGVDRVNASISININDAAHFKGSIENAALIGSASLNLTGNTLGNVLTGNAGANKIAGWFGNDTLTGGGGNDFFLFNSALNAAANRDVITDMNQAGNDTIWLENAIFTTLATGALAATAFRIGAAAADTNDRIVYNSANGQLSYDVNGSAAGGATLFAILDTGLALTAADFFVV